MPGSDCNSCTYVMILNLFVRNLINVVAKYDNFEFFFFFFLLPVIGDVVSKFPLPSLYFNCHPFEFYFYWTDYENLLSCRRLCKSFLDSIDYLLSLQNCYFAYRLFLVIISMQIIINICLQSGSIADMKILTFIYFPLSSHSSDFRIFYRNQPSAEASTVV